MESKLMTVNYHSYWMNSRGLYHKEDGPAVYKTNGFGFKEWFINGKRHRENGPAVKSHTGYEEWWLDNIEYSREGYLKEMRRRKIESLEDPWNQD